MFILSEKTMPASQNKCKSDCHTVTFRFILNHPMLLTNVENWLPHLVEFPKAPHVKRVSKGVILAKNQFGKHHEYYDLKFHVYLHEAIIPFHFNALLSLTTFRFNKTSKVSKMVFCANTELEASLGLTYLE
jgi:hypothetical protein